MVPTTQLVITADDFGADLAINEAVENAHRAGMLSCASLMMGQNATADAIERAHRLPNLGVGLHLTLVCGLPTLPAHAVDALLGDDGLLHTDLTRAGVRWAFHPRASQQIKAEIEAQFQAFSLTGLPLDHVNAHNHMHLHPVVLVQVLKLAKIYGCQWIRLPYQTRGLPWIAYPWIVWMRAQMRRQGYRFNDRVVGLEDSGHITAPHMVRAIEALAPGITELYLHPATHMSTALTQRLPGYNPVGEYEALMSPNVRIALQNQQITPRRFADLV